MIAQQQSPEKIIEQVKKRYQSKDSFQADIVFEIDVPENENQVLKGNIVLSKDKYRFVLPSQQIISDGKTIWHWTNDGEINEVQISRISENESVITPSKIFNQFLDGFNYRLESKTTFNGESLALIEFYPSEVDITESIFKFKAVVNTATHALKEMQVFTKGDGIVYILSFSNEKTIIPTDDLFVFKLSEHSKVEVIDLR